MRIGMVLDQHYPPDPRVENEAKILLENGHEVCLFSFSRSSVQNIQNIGGIKVYYYPQKWLTYKLSALVHTVPFYNWMVCSVIKDFISLAQPDVLHIHDMVITEAVYQANRKHNLPIVLDLHENRPEIMKMYKHVNRFPGKYLIDLDVWKHKQSDLICRSDYIVVVTEEAKEEIVQNNDKKSEQIYVVPNTIDKDIFYSYPKNDSIINRFKGKFNLLYLGDISLRRGTDTAIRAVKELKDKIPNILLTLVGESSQKESLRSLVHELNLVDHVSFEGWQDFSLFPSYIKSSQIGLSPLKRNLHHDTTYANKLFQYMAMGRSVVVSDCPAQAHVVEKEQCGLVFEANNEQSLAQCILTLYENQDLRRKMGNRGRRAVQNTYNWKDTGQSLVSLYNRIDKSN